MNEIWKFNYAKTVGRSHLREKPPVPCQDSVLAIEKNDVIVTALSDGCGSSYVSEVGSDLTVKVLCDYLSSDFDGLYELSNEDIKKKIVACVIGKLTEYIKANPEFISDYAKRDSEHRARFFEKYGGIKNAEKIYPLTILDATIQFVAIKGDRTLIGRLGDGVIGTVQNENLKIQSMEDKIGVENNVTWYPSAILIALETRHKNPWINFEIQKIEDDRTYSAFFLMSDGVADYLVAKDYEKKTDFFYPEETDKIIKENDILNLLENEYKKLPGKYGIFDDLSFSIIKKEDCNFKNVVLREFDSDGKTIANDKLVAYDLDENVKEEIVQEEKTVTSETKDVGVETKKEIIPLDDKFVTLLKKQIGDDEAKYENILNKSLHIWNYMQQKKIATYEDVLNELQPSEMIDVQMYTTYWAKIKLFKVDKKKQTIELR